MLEVKDLHAYYGSSHILQGVNLEVNEGEIVSLLGRNGVGRSTTCKTIMGLVPPQGSIKYNGEEIAGMKSHLIARKGIGFVPEDRWIFPGLTVLQNLELGLKSRGHEGRWSFKDVFHLFPKLGERSNVNGVLISGGEQQMLTIARALMTNPDLLLLDEPTEGLAPLIVELLEEQIAKLKEAGLTVLLAEQNLDVALRLSDRGYVIDNGVIRYEGSIEDLRNNEEVRNKYLLV